MKITSSWIESIKGSKKLFIECRTPELVNFGEKYALKLEVNGKEETYHFDVYRVETPGTNTLIVQLIEYGHWRWFLSRVVNLDIRNLTGKELTLVTDEEVLKELKIESTYL